MRQSRPTRPLRPVRLALVIATLAVALVAPVAASWAATSSTLTYHPTRLSISTTEVPNVSRGQYAWSGQPTQPAGWPSIDTYLRDQVPWGRIEPTRGTYDWTWFDEGIRRAHETGGRFSFRVLAWCPGCFTPPPSWTWTPTWLPLQAGTDVPDWNSETFLSGWEDLMHAIAVRYADDPALGTIDIGAYSKYGEWRADFAEESVTVANARRLANAVLTQFPKQHVVVNAMDGTLTNALLEMSPRIGLRTDCLGGKNMGSLIATAPAGSLMATRWKTQPVLSEWCHLPNPDPADGPPVTVTGAAQVRAYHVSTVSSGNTFQAYSQMPSADQAGFRDASRYAGFRYSVSSVTVPRTISSATRFTMALGVLNTGSAPTYDAWQVRAQVIAADGSVAKESALPITLTSLRPGSRSYRMSFLPPHLAKGTYRLRVVVRDPSGYLTPMRLANSGRTSTGSYTVASLHVG